MNQPLSALLDYALEKQLITPDDSVYAVNRVLALLHGTSFQRTAYPPYAHISDILTALCDAAPPSPDTPVMRDILSAAVMDCFVPYPHEVRHIFWERYADGSQAATDWFYALSQNSHYIMTERTAKNISWRGDNGLYLTVNMSKPEKDNRDIALSRNMVPTGYPKCLLCLENEGFAGSAAHPPRANHRVIPLTLAGEQWYFQYSPYVYYNEHCIVFSAEHRPLRITGQTFRRLLDFAAQFPHYVIGSNADLPVVGGSILTHDHFQGGRFDFPLASRGARCAVRFTGFEDIDACIVDWPLSALRLRGADSEALCALAERLLTAWRDYNDEENGILCRTDQPHNTITAVARREGGQFVLELMLRNNRASEEHPEGIFHAHREYHAVKKEGIGLIEAMGLAVLPGRLAEERNLCDPAVRREIADAFAEILGQCGVFKEDEKGQVGFARFLESAGGIF